MRLQHYFLTKFINIFPQNHYPAVPSTNHFFTLLMPTAPLMHPSLISQGYPHDLVRISSRPCKDILATL